MFISNVTEVHLVVNQWQCHFYGLDNFGTWNPMQESLALSLGIISFSKWLTQNGAKKQQTKQICLLKVRGPFVQTLCIEKDSYMDAIYRVNIFR